MFAWLKRLFRRPASSDRRIFTFWDGTQYRSVDPLPAWRSFKAAMGSDPETALRALYKRPVPGMVGPLLERYLADKEAAAVKVANAACQAFGVAEFADGAGLTEPERIALVRHFVEFMIGLAEHSLPFAKRPGPGSAGSASPTPSSSAAG